MFFEVSGRIESLRAIASRYLAGRNNVAIIGTSARIFALASQVIVLLVMSRLLPKSDFGNAMIAFTLYRVIAVSVGSGLGNVLFVHVAGKGGDHEASVKWHRSMFVTALLVSVILTVPVVCAAPTISSWLGKEGLAPWIVHMSPLLTFTALNSVSAFVRDARSTVNASIILTEVAPNAVRLVAFCILLVYPFHPMVIAHVLWISVAIPLIADVPDLLARANRAFAKLQVKDAKDTLSYAMNAIAGMQLQGVDILICGYLFSSEVSGEYAIAARVAALFPFLAQVVVRGFAPQARYLIARGETRTLEVSVDYYRKLSVATTCISVAGLLLGIAIFIRWSNSAFPVETLLLLTIPPFYRAFFAFSDRILQLAGRATASTIVMVIGFVIVVGFPFVTHEWLGISAIPLAMVISGTILNPVLNVLSQNASSVKMLRARAVTGLVVGNLCLVMIAVMLPDTAASIIFMVGYLSLGIFVATRLRRPGTECVKI